jgi:hypothetical protein
MSCKTPPTSFLVFSHKHHAMENLPDELILEIFSYFQVLQPRAHPSQWFVEPEYRWNLHEPQQRLNALTTLSLTSRRLHKVAETILYSSLIIHYELPYHRAPCFLRTLIARPELRPAVLSVHALGRPFHVSYDVQKMANEMVSEAHRIWTDGDVETWDSLLSTSPIEACLALILVYSFNLRQVIWPCWSKELHVVDLTMSGRRQEAGGSDDESCVVYSQLSSMVLTGEGYVQTFSGIDAFRFPVLRNLQLDQQVQVANWLEPQPKPILANLSSLRLRESPLEFTQLPAIINRCRSLEHLEWTAELMFIEHRDELTSLHAALSTHKDSLKSLSIIADDLHCMFTDEQPEFPQFGRLHDFPALTSLDLPSILLLGAPFAPPDQMPEEMVVDQEAYWAVTRPRYRISELLPRSLQQLRVRDHFELDHSSLIFTHLSEDCFQFPDLNWIRWRKGSSQVTYKDFAIF